MVRRGAGAWSSSNSAAVALDWQPAREKILATLFGPEAPARAPEYSCAARRLLAAECDEFLADADAKNEERWAPYRRWIEQLKEHHTVISFNYDLVIETASAAVCRDIYVALPGQAAPERVPVILKLHGNVDWRRKRERLSGFSAPGSEAAWVSQRSRVEHMLTAADDEIVIASPGPTKFAIASGDLRQLWDDAVTRIQYADAIVFVGYRFPPSDSAARRTLLDAIAANRSDRLRIHTVLGPDVNDPHTRRLSGLLQAALRRRMDRLRVEGSLQVRSDLAHHEKYGPAS